MTCEGALPGGHGDISLLREWADEWLKALHTDPARQLWASRSAYTEEFLSRFHDKIGMDGSE